MRRRHLALAGDEVVVGWSSVSGVRAVSDFGCSCAPGGWFLVDSHSCEIISSGIVGLCGEQLVQEIITAKNRFLGNAVMSGGSGPMFPTRGGLSTSPGHAVRWWDMDVALDKLRLETPTSWPSWVAPVW